MSDKGWKQYERRMALDVGIQRIPVTGERDGADARGERFAYQFKKRKSIPKWLRRWLWAIRCKAAECGQLGVLVLKRPRERDADSVVLMSWDDWCEVRRYAEEQAGERVR